MANLRTAMDASFWDLNISTPQAIDGVCRAVPGDPIPLDGARAASQVNRFLQISLLGNVFPLGIIPSFSPSINHKELGSVALQPLIGRVVIGDWWSGLIGQFRPKKLMSSIKAEVAIAERWDLPLFKEVGNHFLDKSLCALGLCTQIALSSSSSILLSCEKHGERKSWRSKAMLYHKLPEHDITLEASCQELFIDPEGKYWEVPESISLDCLSLVTDTGMRYRLGIHCNAGAPQALDSTDAESPLALQPGVCAKAALSYEKSKYLWRQKENSIYVKTDWCPPYDSRLKDPHAAVSGILGGTCEAWRRGPQVVNQTSFGADLFGSLCCTFQLGRFRDKFGDLSRLDVRLDISSASALAKMVNRFSSAQNNQPPNELSSSSPRLNLIFQQQVIGPIVFRVDSKFSIGSSSGPQLEDLIYSLNYSLRLLDSGKVVAWFSPKRNEGMIELRLYEF